jgi:hypothetical protein
MRKLPPDEYSAEDESNIEEVCEMWRWLLATRNEAANYLETETETNLVAYHAARKQLDEINALLRTYARESRGLSPIRTLYRQNRDTALMMADEGVRFLLTRVHRQGPRGIVTKYRNFAAFERLAAAYPAKLYLRYVGCDLSRLFDLVHSDVVVEMYATKGPSKASALLLGQIRSVSARTVERGIGAALDRLAEQAAREDGERITTIGEVTVMVLASGGVIPGDRRDPLPVMYGPPPEEDSQGGPAAKKARRPTLSADAARRHNLATVTPTRAQRAPRKGR